ncbi:MAG: RNA polymerase sporulation sigma factor SigE, partial [Firmicutes bacterium]|nr:RNA polymerase sporulation sigma factor SigE [Bacillota bacterium]
MNIILRLWKRIVSFLSENIHYIGGSEALPPPLTAEEESELFSKIEQDKKGVRKVLIERNLRLVVYIARKF